MLIGAVVLVVLLVLVFALTRSSVREWLGSNKSWLEPTAYLAAVVGVLVTASMGLATYRQTADEQQQTSKQQKETAEAEAQAAAAGTLQEHLKLATQYPHLATTQHPEVVNERYRYLQNPNDLDPEEYPTEALLEPAYAWFASDAMLAAEVLSATGDEWKKTVEGLVWRHNTYVCHEYAFNSGQYSEDLNKLIGDLDNSEGLCEGDRITRPDNESTTEEPTI